MHAPQPNETTAEIDHAAIALGDRYLEMHARGGDGSPNDDQNVTSLWLLSTPFEDATPDNLERLPGDLVPEDMPAAQRLAMRVTSITGHDEHITVLVHIDEHGEVHTRRVDNDEPMETAENIVRKRLINTPPAANDNKPPYRAPPIPFAPYKAGGLLAAIADWINETNRKAVPEFSMMAAIMFLATLYGRRVTTPTHAGVNLYMIGIGKSGYGKEYPLQAIQRLADKSGFGYLIGPSDVTSGASIEKVLRGAKPNFLMPWDEVGYVFQAFNGKGSPSWAQSIRKVLLEIYSKETGRWGGKEYASADTASSANPIYAPTVSLLGMSTPTAFYRGITEDSLSDGFLARLMVVFADKRPEAKRVESTDVPDSLVNAVRDWAAMLPGGNLAAAKSRKWDEAPDFYTVPWESDYVETYWGSIEAWQDLEIDKSDVEYINRYALHVLKLATIRALSRSPGAPAVTVDDIDWARAIVHHSMERIKSGIEAHMAGSAFEETVKAVQAAITRSGGQMTHSALLKARGVAKYDKRQVDGALERLVRTGWIKTPEPANGGLRITLAPDKND